MSLRDKLKEIERYSFKLATALTGQVRDNYQMVIKRKEDEIAALQAELDVANTKLTGWRTSITQIAGNAEHRGKQRMNKMIDSAITEAQNAEQYGTYNPETVSGILKAIKKEGEVWVI